MIQTIQHNGIEYPAFQGEGFAAKFAIPFAQQVCCGIGYDIGCNRHEWMFKDKNGIPAIPIDPAMNTKYNALSLPAEMKVDYIFSSHCLEHLPDWVEALDYWKTKLKKGGVLFLYLPHPSQTYWRPWHNRKHIHLLQPEMLREYFKDRGWHKIFVSGCDANNSFVIMAENSANKI